MSTISFIARVQEAEEALVRKHLGAARYEAIKARDPHPFFAVHRVAEAGYSSGELGRAGNRLKYWLTETITQIGLKLNDWLNGSPIPCYVTDSAIDHSGEREQVGEVVAGWSEVSESGTRAAYAMTYHPPDSPAIERIKSRDLDASSIEAMAHTVERPSAHPVVTAVKRMLGLVLLSTARGARPGFAGAELVTAIQEAESGAHEYPMYVAEATEPKENMMSLEDLKPGDIKKAILMNDLKPTDVFGVDRLAGDSAIQDAIKGGALKGDLERLGSLEEQNKKLAEQMKSLTEERDTLKAKTIPLDNEKLINSMRETMAKGEGAVPAHYAEGGLFDTAREQVKKLIPAGDTDEKRAEFLRTHMQDEIKRAADLLDRHGVAPRVQGQHSRPIQQQPITIPMPRKQPGTPIGSEGSISIQDFLNQGR